MGSSRVIAIVDFGVGNLRSVAKALEADGFEVEITADPGTLASAAGVVLPGDGNFGAVMEAIHESGLLDATLDAVRRGRPFLGICVGYQMMLESSEESPGVSGLSLIPGTVRRFPADRGLKIPHMGWNTLERISACPLLEDVAEGDMVYFVHSFYPCPVGDDGGAAWTEYGVTFPSVYCKGNLMATQFHPEKSGAVGRGIMRAFGRLC
ncbi:MAG: imidazole glycerol phosphate synthase subunit HisH, partial [Chloroflexi bacterium]|nr:imidazole glycerol phosphate synthase subunit HisH [Chloroflexota bacterium]